METLFQLHPLSIVGVVLVGTGILILLLLSFNNELSYGSLKLKGNLHRTKKWPVMLKTAIGFIVSGTIFIAIGFGQPDYHRDSHAISERTWHGTWDIEFCGEGDHSDISTVKFEHLNHREGVFLQARLYDSEGGELGTFQRLQPDASHDDFRILKGQFKLNGNKPIVIELALHGNKETFSGTLYKPKLSQRQTCWGKKR